MCSHHVIVTLDSGPQRQPFFPLRRRSGIACVVTHEREGDAGELVGGRHGDKLERLGLHQAIGPASQRIAATFAMEEDRVSADNEQLAQISVSHLGNSPQPLLAA